MIGRKIELKQLDLLKKKKTASLVCVLGRRRIGKSHLIQEFGKTFKNFFQFQGLGPDEKSSMENQLENFTFQFNEQTNKNRKIFDNWTEALTELFQCVKQGEVLILLDEISWMGKGDPLFASKLKDVWDRHFKKNPKLILVLCGSVSTWIQDNILENANFEGRISLRILLRELDLKSINEFWERKSIRMGSLEKMLILSVTGGVPKYLEEVLSSQSVESNLIRLCFTPNGLLYNDYDFIFKSVLGRLSNRLDKIIRICLSKKQTPQSLANALKIDYNSELSRSLEILELSGFLRRDFSFKPTGDVSKLSQLRVSDNYLRFYLKNIEPLKAKIEKGGKQITSLYDLKNLDSMLGYQFENLILHNRSDLYPFLDLSHQQIHSAAPYIQNKTTINKGACQVDLLIHSNLDVFYLCEFKCQKIIDKSILKEVIKKMNTIALPRRSAVKPVLVYEGEIYKPHEEEINRYFYKVIPFASLLQQS